MNIDLPESNNVYGLLVCKGTLDGLEQVLKGTPLLKVVSVTIKKSQFNGAQTLRWGAAFAEFQVYESLNQGEYLFNGVVAGTDEEVTSYVKILQSALSMAGYRSSFEVYDNLKKCVAEL